MRTAIGFLFSAIAICFPAIATGGVQGRLTDFESRILLMHNQERSANGLDGLRWNAGLAEDARVWADLLVSTGRFEHSPNLPGKPLQGENIWGGTPGAWTPEHMVGLWLAERKHFKRGLFPANSVTGNVADVSHFTQIIWPNTRSVGCALAQGAKEEILVCRYSRPGNIVGQTPLGPPPVAT